ncbi:DUF1819 family protein [Maliponia aquimaris]|uniref:Inner membrane protein (DUF1819) n=1 Tax=Maliponia aquimaris TaxID=1673631 RepID=A0A238L4K4_9RHOB|nr:DUF1819 family protein [Maliponia aquimaris]SMX49927.1 hypothetical protein MAA8898_04513 [Maliponia aquimaris]
MTESGDKYRMSFTTGGLFLNESLELTRVHEPGEPWADTVARAMESGTASLPKSASNKRTLREIGNRIRTLSDDERQFLLATADRSDQQAILWLAMCRAYRFVREFAVEVVRDRHLSYQLELPYSAFDILLDSKAEWHPELEKLSDSTRRKLRQILFRIMREAAIITQDDRIQTAILSRRLLQMIEERDPRELAYFPGIPVSGGPN